MLAFHYKDNLKHIKYPIYMQPKLDGIRLLYQNGVMQSRSHGKEEAVVLGPERLKHLRNILSTIEENIVLDGELYVHGWSRQQINRAARVRSLDDGPTSFRLQYHIFDAIDTNNPHLTFLERAMLLWRLQRKLLSFDSICFVDTYQVDNNEASDTFYRMWKAEGYEGAMYRFPDEPYGFEEECGNKENRWKRILKRKDWLDGEFECVGIEEGEGKYVGKVGALCLVTKDRKQFNCGSGLTDADREAFWHSPPIGSLIHIRYDIVSDDGTPIQPRYDHIIED